MSLFRGGNSSSTTQNFQTTVGGDNGSLVANQNSQIQILDGGAIKESFAFAGDALDAAQAAGRASIDAALGISSDSAASVQSAISKLTTGGVDRLLMILIVTMGAVAAIYLFRKR